MNSLVFILLIGILGSIIYSYTYKRIYSEVDQSIKMIAQYREKLDVKVPPRKRMENIQIGDPRVTRITWNGKIVKIEGDNRKFRSIFEENLESFSPEKLEELQDIEVQGRYFRAFSLQKDGEIVQIVRDITAEEGMLNTLFLILVIGCSIGCLCAIGIGFFLAGREHLYLFKVHGRNSNNSFLMHHMNSGHHLQLFNQKRMFYSSHHPLR